MTTPARYDRGQLIVMARELAKAMEDRNRLLEQYGEDKAEGTVIRFQKRFADIDASWDAFPADAKRRAELEAATLYTYAGIRAGNGQWYLTGRSTRVKTDGIEWDELIFWLDDGIEAINVEFWPPAAKGEIEDAATDKS